MSEFSLETADAPAAAPRADVMQRKATRIRVFTPSGIVEGDFHHPQGVRVSDFLRNASTGERYLLLTNVSLLSTTGAEIDGAASSAPFILINTQHTSMLVPLEDE